MSRHLLDITHEVGARTTRSIWFLIGLVCVRLSFARGFAARGNPGILARVGFDGARLQRNPDATVSGKGTAQSMHELSFGGTLRYASAYCKTPRGYAIDKAGINPNVEMPQVLDAGVDNQKNLAVESAKTAAGL